MIEEGGSVHVRVSFRKSVTVVTKGLVPGLGLWQWEQKWVRREEQQVESVSVFRDPLDLE